MPEGVGYSDEELKAAETLLGASSAEDLLQKASELGISLMGGGPMDGPPVEESPLDEPPMGEELEESEEDSRDEDTPEGPPEGPAGLLIGLTTKRNNAAGKAMKKHGYK